MRRSKLFLLTFSFTLRDLGVSDDQCCSVRGVTAPLSAQPTPTHLHTIFEAQVSLQISPRFSPRYILVQCTPTPAHRAWYPPTTFSSLFDFFYFRPWTGGKARAVRSGIPTASESLTCQLLQTLKLSSLLNWQFFF